MSITPLLFNFTSPIIPLSTKSLRSLTTLVIVVVAEGKACWLIEDVHVIIRQLITTTYYVLHATLSPDPNVLNIFQDTPIPSGPNQTIFRGEDHLHWVPRESLNQQFLAELNCVKLINLCTITS